MKYPFLFTAILMLVLTGCDRGAKDPRLVMAERCRDEGDFSAAERQFRQYLNAHPQAAKVHLHLASLYDESIGDPLSAVCHYREYLRLVPNAPDAAMVKQWMQQALVKCSPAKAPEVRPPAPPASPELQRLAQENAALRRLVIQQQQELVRLRNNPAPAASASPTAPTVRPAPAAPAAPAAEKMLEYTVQSGDHLGKIARRFYGSSQMIEPILTANGLRAGSVLHIGQKLKIPKKTR